MNNARYSRPTGRPNIYRPSETERLQAQLRNQRLRNIQEKRHSIGLDSQDETTLRKSSNEFNVAVHVKDEPFIENNENKDDDEDSDVNISKDNKSSPFYDYNTDKTHNILNGYDDGYDEPSPLPKVMSPKSVLKSRGYSSASYDEDPIVENPIRYNNENNKNLLTFQATESRKEIRRNEQNNMGSRTLRKLLGEPLPLPYLSNDVIVNKSFEDNHRTVLTKDKLDNKSKHFNTKFKRLVSKDKINVVKRLNELKHKEYDNDDNNDDGEDILTNFDPPIEPLPKFGNKIRKQRAHSRSYSHDLSFPSRQPSVQFSIGDHEHSRDSVDHNNLSDTDSTQDLLILLELQRTLDSNSEKLDLIIAMLSNLTPETKEKTKALYCFYSKHILIRTICIITLLLSIFCVYYYYYYNYYKY
ncbi:similar to Saccharomyces cerevisiae YNL188W KAR1 Essential protein involved in karyogamy during mating and in spindle pole body duplication during mitosis [Maudiozyma saulgeensis]|uniref:Similar to Saccharomyces cerevisiae YNL188W KAR1 Essential protein involved in karyogamy during mating and in spindle pole body duplication during mitosis n=1 Tax=Maudiozyma saulgeensis TaxID=1789683 RepID=A0A1X7R2W5_9SACH|nr:similar to Saccharomyces cerevisiae YNL188W KAR1 Essential protein involved in karyogamy during mating and in spindle pole body duplication during mitosis [Kazachstania saulgeensis]